MGFGYLKQRWLVSSYVDDLIHSCMGDSLLLARKVHEVLKGHGFSVKQWQFRGEASGRSEEDLFNDKPTLSGPNLLKGGLRNRLVTSRGSC